MEEAPPANPTVAELAGKFKGQALPLSRTEETNPVRRNPLFSLQLHKHTDGESGEEKPAHVSPHPPKAKLKSSPLIEKLQANLTLTPPPLLTLPKGPEAKLQATPLCIISPCGPLSPALRPPQANEDELPVSFEQPAEGSAPLLNINKTRVRLSFKRRLPTRQHRKSAGEEPGEENSSPSQADENGEDGEVPSAPRGETEVNLEDSSDPATGPSTGVGRGGPEDTREGQGGEAGGGGGLDTPSTVHTIEAQQEERLHEDQSPEQMEGVEEGGDLGGDLGGELPATHEENRELKDQRFGDGVGIPGAEGEATLAE